MGSRLAFVVCVGAAIAIACGSSGSHKNPDATLAGDASVKDAPPGGANGIGRICTGGGSGDPNLCPASDPICVTVHSGGGPPYFCTKSCGTSTSNTMPPSGGDAICKVSEQSPGTPRCLLSAPGSNGSYPWACGIECGMNGGSNW